MNEVNEILNNKQFLDAFKKRCIEEHLESFYEDISKAMKFGKTVELKGDLGDEVFNAAYNALKDIGKIRTKDEVDVSPYDILEMKSISKNGKPYGISVKFNKTDDHEKKKILPTGWFNPYAKQPKHSYVDTKELDDFDIEYLRLLLIAEENNVMKVLENEKWYSEETIERYKKMKESIKNLQNAVHVKREFEDVQRIPESW